MNTARLKNIVILILLLANAFLLVLLLSRRTEERRAYDRSLDELLTLYASSGITLDRSLLEETTPQFIDTQPERNLAAEQTFAEGVIGTGSSLDSGGGIYRYYSADGTCLFRSSGALEAAVNRTVEGDLTDYCAGLCLPSGYTIYSTLEDGERTVVTATRTINDLEVYNADLTFTFSGSTLTAITGFFLPAFETSEADAHSLDLITALVRFLDYRSESGVVCTEILSLSGGYLLQSTASVPQQLVPVFKIQTDVYSYYVNILSGEVSRE